MIAAIFLKSLKLPYEEIYRRILELDFERKGSEPGSAQLVISTELLEQLAKLLPEKSTLTQLEKFRSEYDFLTEAEQFLLTVWKKISEILLHIFRISSVKLNFLIPFFSYFFTILDFQIKTSCSTSKSHHFQVQNSRICRGPENGTLYIYLKLCLSFPFKLINLFRIPFL